MNSSAFGRIVWKECRAQLSLWLALVIGAFVLQATILFSQGTHVQGLGFVVAAAFVLTACFAVASVALLFAGETEDGTRNWLQQLPMQPIVLVTSKLTFAVVASVLLLAATLGTGMLATELWHTSAGDLFQADLSEVDYPLGSIVGLFAWGLFFSLRNWRVPLVLLGAVVAEIVTLTVTERALYGFSRSATDASPQTIDMLRTVTYVAVVAILLVIDLVLAWRWAGGGAGATTTAPRRLPALSMPLGQWRTTTWLAMVAWAARRGSPSARETAVLLWREARAAVPIAVVWLLLGVLATDLLSIDTQPGSFRYQRPFQVLFLIATPAVCGLMTCLGDQRQQTFRFLAERGVSPARIWWTKQCVWASVALALTLLFVRWDSSATEALQRGRNADASLFMLLTTAARVPTLMYATPSGSGYNRPEDFALQMQFLWSLGLALFAAGQCAAFWIRRTVLAFGTVLIVVPILIAWHWYLVQSDIPLSLGSWPLSFALMAATLISAGAWLRGRDSWRLRFLRLAAIALPVCAVATAAAAHRACSVPKPVFTQELANAVATRTATFDSFDAVWSGRWRAALAEFRSPVTTLVPLQLSAEQRARLRDVLIALSDEIDNRPGRFDALVLSPDQPLRVGQLGLFLASPPTADPDTAAESGGSSAMMALQGAPAPAVPEPEPIPESIQEQWRAYEAGLKITRCLARECVTSEQWLDCIRARTPLLKAVRDWSQRADQTPETLQPAVDYLTEELLSHVGTREMAINRYVFYSQLLEQRGRKWREIERQMRERGGFSGEYALMIGAVLPPFERERTLRLLGHVTADHLENRSSLFHALQPRGLQLERWAASTAGMPVNVLTELYANAYTPGFFEPHTLGGAFESNRAQTAGTALVVALQRHRLLHGAFPDSLIDVIPEQYGPQVFSDPYSGSLFGYAPHGLPGDLYLAGGRVLRSGQPLLWSAGYGNRAISQSTRPYPTRPPDGPEVPRGAYFATGHNLLLPPAGGFHFEDPQPDRIEFLNVGTQPTW